MQRHWRYFVATAVAVTINSTACQMDPVAFDDSAEHPSPFDDLPRIAASLGGASARSPVDPTRPRFRLDFSVSGTMTPNASVTVTLSGEAVESFSRGTVAIMLPTMAAMANVSAGSKLDYPIDQKYPVMRSYSLPAMSSGDTWQRSFAVTLPAKGYYSLSAKVDTNVPASERDGWVMDDNLYYRRWMLVTDAGGHLTRRFDESVFTDNTIAPVPGPFRKKARHQTAAAAYGGGMAYSMAPVRKKVTYDEDAPKAAKDADAFATLYQGSGPDVEQVATYHRTVASNGIVTFPCPGTGHWLEGGVSLPVTAEVNAGTLIVPGRLSPSRSPRARRTTPRRAASS